MHPRPKMANVTLRSWAANPTMKAVIWSSATRQSSRFSSKATETRDSHRDGDQIYPRESLYLCLADKVLSRVIDGGKHESQMWVRETSQTNNFALKHGLEFLQCSVHCWESRERQVNMRSSVTRGGGRGGTEVDVVNPACVAERTDVRGYIPRKETEQNMSSQRVHVLRRDPIVSPSFVNCDDVDLVALLQFDA